MVKTFLAASAALVALAAPALAQNGLPAEFPPASYTASQYIDSTGCAFIRSGPAGATTWVPRVSRQRQQLCGFQPSLGTAAAVAAAPAPVVSPRVVAPPPITASPAAASPVAARLTRAELCRDRFGPQPGYVSSRDGAVIDCGPAPRVAAAPPAIGSTMTLAQLCARIAETGQGYVVRDTGAPVSCAPVADASVRVRLEAPLAAPRARLASRSPVAPALALPDPVAPPSGYRPVWTDGRLNPNRGVVIVERAGAGRVAAPVPAAPVTLPATGPVARISSRSPAPDGTAHRYVQVGVYADAGNAARSAQRLQRLGLPVEHDRLSRYGSEMRVVIAGPFEAGATLQEALVTARRSGFPDAFTRR